MNLHPSQYPAGTKFPAGLGWATVLPDADFETYSEAGAVYNPVKETWHGPPNASKGQRGLTVVGAAVYATHHTTEVLRLSYNLKDGRGPRFWIPGMPLPADLISYVLSGGLIESWNSGFEWWIWNYVCVPKYGFPPLPVEQMRCAMGKARAGGWPGKLDIAGDAMGLVVRKDKRGEPLVRKLTQPCNPTKANGGKLRYTRASNPEDFRVFDEYNDTDIVTEAEASAYAPDLEGEELAFWLADQAICRRGVHVDADSLAACADIVRLCLVRYDSELHQITGGMVERASQLDRLRGWLRTQGIVVAEGPKTMDDDAITELLKQIPKWPQYELGRRALEIRQAVGSASVKKVFAMANQLSPWQRLHDLFNYHGARTGRPTGEGPQPTNLPKDGPDVIKCGACGRYSGAKVLACIWCKMPQPPEPARKVLKWEEAPTACEDVLAVIKLRNLALLEACFGQAMLCISGCLRGLFTAAPGKELVAADFSSIEGVVTACIAGEDWRVEMFATHGKAYELGVSKITGIPFAEIMAHAGYEVREGVEWWKPEHRKHKGKHHPLRQGVGKVSELASGFGGGKGAWIRFGALEPDKGNMQDHEIGPAIKKWREESPNIVELWGGQYRKDGYYTRPELYGLEGMAIKAIQNPGTWCPVMRRDGTHTGVTYGVFGDALFCQIPSGRFLTYHRPRLGGPTKDWQPADHISISFEGYNSNVAYGAKGWVRMGTYGGKLCENVVQATARDIQRHAMVKLEAMGHPIVLHVYDEIVCETLIGALPPKELERIMSEMPPWATYRGKPWPIKAADGWASPRYRK